MSQKGHVSAKNFFFKNCFVSGLQEQVASLIATDLNYEERIQLLESTVIGENFT